MFRRGKAEEAEGRAEQIEAAARVWAWARWERQWREGRRRGGRGGILISATGVGLFRGQVGADGMARARPTAPMRQPRHQHGEGGSARLYGSGAAPRSRERREGTVGSGQGDVLPWADGAEHAGEGAAGE